MATVERVPYEYVVIRAVPRVDRGEFLNVGVILYCRTAEFLGAAVHLDDVRLAAIAPDADPAPIHAALRSLEHTCCQGFPGDTADGNVPDLGKRFRWLTAPRSTVVQPGPVHTGLTSDPRVDLNRLVDRLVR